ncbi:hypothetical protein KSK55_01895 [Methanospirillum purgamenti]|uniref:Uncharacterized protein n=1 Tax=Methanospirillum hungatei TaxID=2203 RepID=A0A8F5VLD8_METHU|nr:hypothetical protein [Methanospirillum hungatei]QXO95191.1 hypothetical protein KSK55_01895 [Methanospirillum hungatei]
MYKDNLIRFWFYAWKKEEGRLSPFICLGLQDRLSRTLLHHPAYAKISHAFCDYEYTISTE